LLAATGPFVKMQFWIEGFFSMWKTTSQITGPEGCSMINGR